MANSEDWWTIDHFANAGRSIVADSTFEVEIKDEEIQSEKAFTTGNISLSDLSEAKWSLCVKLSNGNAHFHAHLHEIPDEWRNGLQLKLFVKSGGINPFETTIIAKDDPIPSSIPNLAQHYLFNSIVLTFRLVICCKRKELSESSHDPQDVRNYIFSGVSKMFGDPTFADFTFVVRGQEFKVHMNILAAASPVMRRMFTSSLAEATTKTCTVDAIDPEIFALLLRFVYRGELSNDLRAVSKPLYEAAHYYGIEKLKIICAREINKDLSLENALQVFNWIPPFEDFKQLKHNAWAIINCDILKIVDKPQPISVAQVLAFIEQERKLQDELQLS